MMTDQSKNGIGRTLAGFIRTESASGLVLIAVTILALVWMNSDLAYLYKSIWKETKVMIGVGDFVLSESVYHWINDGLMAVFFLLVGLEIKRELIAGELSDLKKALFPIIAAIGGMVVPALIYYSINHGHEEFRSGWAIPMATDIAFSLGILTLLGSRVPVALKVFLTALAIVDDMGAVLSIAIFYSDSIEMLWIAVALAVFLLLIALNRLGVRKLWAYLIIGIFGLWLPFYLSGVHATIAGVLLALAIPASRKIDTVAFNSRIRTLLSDYAASPEEPGNKMLDHHKMQAVSEMHETCDSAKSPLQWLEHRLKWPTMFLIVPLFALANAGASFKTHSVTGVVMDPVALGIILGLVVGKSVGISLFAWMAVKTRLVSLPDGLQWKHIIGVGFIAGIGFTMSLFINELAFENSVINEVAKKAIFAGSLISGVIGAALLFLAGRRK
ncbi:MAG: Na+/H+ antiporter NhaA [Bacteroidales bacterium]